LKKFLILLILCLGANLTGCVVCLAASYPAKQIHLIVPYPPGGGNDTIARALAQKMEETFKTTVIVENKPGANGIIAAEYVARSEPDGYTLFMANNGSHGINPSLYKKVNYDPIKDFVPISLVATSPNVLVVSPTLGVHSIKDLIAYAKKSATPITYGSNGAGSSQHMAGALFSSTFGLDTLHIPYKGTGPMMTDLLGGRLTMSFGNIVAVLPQVQAGKLEALAVTTPQRSAALPEVPALAETMPGFDATVWWALVAAKGAPPEAVSALNQVVQAFARDPKTAKLMERVGAQPSATTPEELGAFIASELTKWAKVIKETGATAD
jgi:tripartite-type tricarboxylate transporter receptor subunit TctC